MITGSNSTDFDEFLLVLGVLDPNQKSNLDEGSIEVMTKSDLSTSTSTSTNKSEMRRKQRKKGTSPTMITTKSLVSVEGKTTPPARKRNYPKDNHPKNSKVAHQLPHQQNQSMSLTRQMKGLSLDAPFKYTKYISHMLNHNDIMKTKLMIQMIATDNIKVQFYVMDNLEGNQCHQNTNEVFSQSLLNQNYGYRGGGRNPANKLGHFSYLTFTSLQHFYEYCEVFVQSAPDSLLTITSYEGGTNQLGKNYVIGYFDYEATLVDVDYVAQFESPNIALQETNENQNIYHSDLPTFRIEKTDRISSIGNVASGLGIHCSPPIGSCSASMSNSFQASCQRSSIVEKNESFLNSTSRNLLPNQNNSVNPSYFNSSPESYPSYQFNHDYSSYSTLYPVKGFTSYYSEDETNEYLNHQFQQSNNSIDPFLRATQVTKDQYCERVLSHQNSFTFFGGGSSSSSHISTPTTVNSKHLQSTLHCAPPNSASANSSNSTSSSLTSNQKQAPYFQQTMINTATIATAPAAPSVIATANPVRPTKCEGPKQTVTACSHGALLLTFDDQGKVDNLIFNYQFNDNKHLRANKIDYFDKSNY